MQHATEILIMLHSQVRNTSHCWQELISMYRPWSKTKLQANLEEYLWYAGKKGTTHAPCSLFRNYFGKNGHKTGVYLTLQRTTAKVIAAPWWLQTHRTILEQQCFLVNKRRVMLLSHAWLTQWLSCLDLSSWLGLVLCRGENIPPQNIPCSK